MKIENVMFSNVRITVMTELHASGCSCTRCQPWRTPEWTGGGLPIQTWWIQLEPGESPPPGFQRPPSRNTL